MSYKWPLMTNIITWKDKWDLVKFIATSDRFTNGPRVRKFESEWNQWLGSQNSLFVSNGSCANLLLMSAIRERFGLRRGAKVIVPACTWVTNISPVIQCGLRPIFCDVNLENYSFDLEHLKLIASKHHDIKAVFFTHLLGFSADLEAVREILPNALFLEDVCESHGCLAPDGKRRGHDALGATFSFYFGHHMTTVEGGMVSTHDEELYSIMRAKRSHGLARELPGERFEQAKDQNPLIDPNFLFVTAGYNFRNTEIAAVLGSSQLSRLDNTVRKRNENFAAFMSIMEQHEDRFYLPSKANTTSSYAFPLILRDGNKVAEFKTALAHAGVEYRPIVGGNLLLQPFLSKHKIEAGSDMNVQILNDNGVYIGNNQHVGEAEMALLEDVLNQTS